MDVTVQTENGVVRGASDNGLSVFKGIPYAAPLNGPRRFQAPAAPHRWDGVRDAGSFGASVPQAAMAGDWPVVWSPGDSTDCLSVNVWTPDLGDSALPVMVWIHGGAFLHGTSAIPDYDGAAYARNGVVFVSLNYRLGYEGFGWVSDAPSNRGVLDQLAALRWVQDNIGGFGGDPDNVTVFGQSAGATSVAALVASPAARGLVHRGIAQSAGGLFVAEDEARKVAELITGELGVAPSAEALSAVPSETVHGAHNAALMAMMRDPSAWTNSFTPYSVILDGELLDSRPWEAMRAGAGREVDLISGFTTDECSLFTVDTDLSGVDPVDAARGLRLPPAAVEEYRAGNPGISDFELHTLMLSDSLFRMPSSWCAEAHAYGGGRTYLYEFAWRSPARDGALGACHGLDVPFTFGVAGGSTGEPLIGSTAPASFEPLSQQIRTAWTSFAATGDPGWPEFRAGEALTRRWDVTSTVVSDPVAASRRIWEHHA